MLYICARHILHIAVTICCIVSRLSRYKKSMAKHRAINYLATKVMEFAEAIFVVFNVHLASHTFHLWEGVACEICIDIVQFKLLLFIVWLLRISF